MQQLAVTPGGPLRGRVRVPGDKSISHRALLLGAIASGRSEITSFLPAGDCLATLACMRALGIEVAVHDLTTLSIHGRGLHGLRPPAAHLDCSRSGTTMRLLAGLLAGQPFDSVLTGDPQLLRRPMRRVVEPLRRMGAQIEDTDGRAPLLISGRRLHGHNHVLPIASAQVKSALLLAGLYADGVTSVQLPGPARDHTERMMFAMGAPMQMNGATATLSATRALLPLSLAVPGDASSAAFLLAAAAVLPGSDVTIEAVGVNPTRTGLLDTLRSMGADVTVSRMREMGNEPVADVTVKASELRGVSVNGDDVVRMIDELPVLAVVATQAHGLTVVKDASELRVKETDRITTTVTELRTLGAQIEPLPDGFAVEGPTQLRGCLVKSHGDHRLAMALSVAGLLASGETVVQDVSCIDDSFPGFSRLLISLRH